MQVSKNSNHTWDVIIAGAGVVGCAAARELARYPLRVLVLEKGPDVCSGTSKGNSAMVHAGHDPEPGSLKAKYNVLGNKMFDTLCAELDVPFERNGLITFATNEAAMEKLYAQRDNAAKNGVEVHILDLAGLREIEPGMGDGVIGGLWAPASGMVCPYNLVIAMAENAAANGVEFLTDTEVLDIAKTPEGFEVKTNNGAFTTRTVLNSAGTHAGRLNNCVSAEKITIIPRQGEHLIMDRKYMIGWLNTSGGFAKQNTANPPRAEGPQGARGPERSDAAGVWESATGCPLPPTVGPPSEDLPGGGHTKGMGLMPSVDGTIIIGCNAVEVDDPDDVRSTAAGIGEILTFCRSYWDDMPIARKVPGFPQDGIISMFSGVRAHPVDDDYHIGEAADAPGFYNAAGIESPGLTAGPAIAQDLAEQIAAKLGAQPRANYVPGRKIKAPFRTMSRAQREAAIKVDPDYAKIVCRCEQVTEAEIRDAIRRPLGARSVTAVKMRTRAGMGRCQGGFCGPRVVEILCEELGLSPLEVNQSSAGSTILAGEACGGACAANCTCGNIAERGDAQ